MEKTIRVRGSYTAYADVNVSTYDIYEALLTHFRFRDAGILKDGNLYYREDVSHHGSPIYEDTLITDNPKVIELFKAVKTLGEYLKRPDSPEYKY